MKSVLKRNRSFMMVFILAAVVAALWQSLALWHNANTNRTAENFVDRDSYNHQKTFDFSDESQLALLPSFGKDPSVISNGKLKCPIAQNTYKGLGRKFIFSEKPDEAEISFSIHMDANFQKNGAENESGKFPGFEGIYDDTAGWGGKPVTDQKSWSIRVGHGKENENGKIPIGLYIYHPGMSGQYGTVIDIGIALEKERDYKIELYTKLNDIGNSNGVIKMFIDDDEVYSSDTWILRTDNSVHIKSVWLDVYIGGTTPSSEDTCVLIDDLVIKW